MALSCVVSVTFNVENVVTLKSGLKITQGHWEWYHSIDCVWFPMCSLVILSLKCTVFEIFDFKNAVTLKTFEVKRCGHLGALRTPTGRGYHSELREFDRCWSTSAEIVWTTRVPPFSHWIFWYVPLLCPHGLTYRTTEIGLRQGRYYRGSASAYCTMRLRVRFTDLKIGLWCGLSAIV